MIWERSLRAAETVEEELIMGKNERRKTGQEEELKRCATVEHVNNKVIYFILTRNIKSVFTLIEMY